MAVSCAAVVLAACGSNSGSSTPTKTSAATPKPVPHQDGVLQVRSFVTAPREITLQQPDGKVVGNATLPFDPQNEQALGAGEVLYTSSGSDLAVVDGSGKVHAFTAPGEDYSREIGLSAPWSQRYALLTPAAQNNAVLLDTTTFRTFTLAQVLHDKGLVASAVTAPDGSSVLLDDVQGAALFTPFSSVVHRFSATSLGEGFTTDGRAIVLDEEAGEVQAYSPGNGQTTTLGKPHAKADGPLYAAPVGTSVVTADRKGIFVVDAAGKTRQVSAPNGDLNRLIPAADGRHVLISTGEDSAQIWYLLDVRGGSLHHLAALDSTTVSAGDRSQRYLLFGPGDSSGATLHTAYGVDTETGDVQKVSFPAGAIPGNSSVDGKVRALAGLSREVGGYVVDLSTGNVTSFPNPVGASPAGDALIRVTPRKPLTVTDLQGQTKATLVAEAATWTAR